VQALGSDKVKLRSCPNVRPDTGVHVRPDTGVPGGRRDRKHPRQKVGNDQEVPLLGKTFSIVKRQPKPADMSEDSRIFPVEADTITTIFPRAKKALGIVDLHFHDLRHEGVSRLFE
jgi:integrase